MQLTLTKVIKRDTDKQGNALISKQGKPYARASIQTTEYGSEWLGGFWNASLVEGAKIEAEVTDREYNGKTYKDFKMAKKEDPTAQTLRTIMSDLVTVKLILRSIDANTAPRKKVPYTTPEEEGIDVNKAFPEDDIEDEMSQPPQEE